MQRLRVVCFAVSCVLLISSAATLHAAKAPQKSLVKTHGGDANSIHITLDELLKRSIRAEGGKGRVEAVRSTMMAGSDTEAGESSNFVRYDEASRKGISVRKTSDGIEIDGRDDSTQWKASAKDGITKRPNTAGATVDLGNLIHYPIQLMEMYEHMRYSRLDFMDHRQVYVVDADSDGEPISLYFDSKTFLLVRVKYATYRRIYTGPFYAELEDYRKVDGIQVPFTIRQRLKDHVLSEVRLQQVQINIPLDDRLFAAPKSWEDAQDRANNIIKSAGLLIPPKP